MSKAPETPLYDDVLLKITEAMDAYPDKPLRLVIDTRTYLDLHTEMGIHSDWCRMMSEDGVDPWPAPRQLTGLLGMPVSVTSEPTETRVEPADLRERAESQRKPTNAEDDAMTHERPSTGQRGGDAGPEDGNVRFHYGHDECGTSATIDAPTGSFSGPECPVCGARMRFRSPLGRGRAEPVQSPVTRAQHW